MVMANIEYPEKGCSTPCPAMRCQKCVLHNSESVFNYLAKDREKDRPDWCPIVQDLSSKEAYIICNNNVHNNETEHINLGE